MDYKEKSEKLLEDIKNYCDDNIVIAFSGGIDSSLLLKLACDISKEKGNKVYAVTIHTKLHPMNDLDIAKNVAFEMGALHKIIYVDELKEADIENNPIDRCYRCKKHLFSELRELCKELSATHLIDGTNFDDLGQYRPGIKALKELEVISPLAENEFTKNEVRKLAKEFDISVANRPSAPCMATRFPYNTPISYEVMEKIEVGEDYIRDLGFYNVRIRVHKDIARIEVDTQDFELFMIKKDMIVKKLLVLGFKYVTLDLQGFRSGSMDIDINVVEKI
ncbi:MAG: ATP-dependent sacrificial sulfur transferase LarE [Lachnospirales bacterium]